MSLCLVKTSYNRTIDCQSMLLALHLSLEGITETFIVVVGGGGGGGFKGERKYTFLFRKELAMARQPLSFSRRVQISMHVISQYIYSNIVTNLFNFQKCSGQVWPLKIFNNVLGLIHNHNPDKTKADEPMVCNNKRKPTYCNVTGQLEVWLCVKIIKYKPYPSGGRSILP